MQSSAAESDLIVLWLQKARGDSLEGHAWTEGSPSRSVNSLTLVHRLLVAGQVLLINDHTMRR